MRETRDCNPLFKEDAAAMAGIEKIAGPLTPRNSATDLPQELVRAGLVDTARASRLTDLPRDSVTLSDEAVAARKGTLSQGPISGLSPKEQAQVQRLQQVDRQVRQHEQAHLAVAGAYARGGANYSYTTGPDGRQYATGGEVSMDVSPERTPEATIRKMETVKRAAVAPANPSSQDRTVYAAAAQTELAAQQQLAKEQQQGTQEAAGLATEVQKTTNANRGAAPGNPIPQAELQGRAAGEPNPEAKPGSAMRNEVSREHGARLLEGLLRNAHRNAIRNLEPRDSTPPTFDYSV